MKNLNFTFLLLLIVLILHSCNEEITVLKSNQIDLQKLETCEELVYKIDTLLCNEPKQKQIELIYKSFSIPILNVCFSDYGCYLIDRMKIVDDEKAEYSIYDNDEQLKLSIRDYFLNPNRDIHLPRSPDRGVISLRFKRDMPIEKVVFQLKRMDRLYNEIEGMVLPIRIFVEFDMIPPPPPPLKPF